MSTHPLLISVLLLTGTVPSAGSAGPMPSPGEPVAAARRLAACRPLGLAPGVVPASSVLAWRATRLQSGIGIARTAKTLTQEQADSLWQQAERVRTRVADTPRLPVKVRADAYRTLESVAAQLCHR
jgi:hypothetical protein